MFIFRKEWWTKEVSVPNWKILVVILVLFLELGTIGALVYIKFFTSQSIEQIRR
jgi:hypothetical protein